MHREQRGFTLIELVIVIVILGLLAATALPRFIDITHQARLSGVQGIAGGLAGAASLAKAEILVNGSSGAGCGGGAGTACMDGIAVAVNASGYPFANATGIIAAIQANSGGTINGYVFTPAGAPTTGTAMLWPTNGGSATCDAEYTANTAAVVVNSTGC